MGVDSQKEDVMLDVDMVAVATRNNVFEEEERRERVGDRTRNAVDVLVEQRQRKVASQNVRVLIW